MDKDVVSYLANYAILCHIAQLGSEGFYTNGGYIWDVSMANGGTCLTHVGWAPEPGFTGDPDDPNDPNYSPPAEDPSGGFGDANLPTEPVEPVTPVLPVEPSEDPSGGFGDAGAWAARLFGG